MSNKIEKATLGGGCFWCIEAVYQNLKGVQKVESGYAAGKTDNPTYEQVCSGMTGHAEVVQITFESNIISYEEILYIFWRLHDPTQLDRQGADCGTQYRSIILTHASEQQEIAEKSRHEADTVGLYPHPIVTEIEPLTVFYQAEIHHQSYYSNNSNQPYCRVVIDPKIQKLKRDFGDKLV